MGEDQEPRRASAPSQVRRCCLVEETSMAVAPEIAPNIYRISIFAQRGNLQFNHFLVKDDEPLLFHTGLRGMHAEIREAVSKLINPFRVAPHQLQPF
jgi:flavorubredoxin